MLKQMGAGAEFAVVEVSPDMKHQINHFFGGSLTSQAVWAAGVIGKALSGLPIKPAMERRSGDAPAEVIPCRECPESSMLNASISK